MSKEHRKKSAKYERETQLVSEGDPTCVRRETQLVSEGDPTCVRGRPNFTLTVR